VAEKAPQQIGDDMKQRAGEQGQQQDAGGQAAQGRRIHRSDLVQEREKSHRVTRKINPAHHDRTVMPTM